MPNTTTRQAAIIVFPEARVGLVGAFIRGLPSEATRKVYRRVLEQFDTFLGDHPMDRATRQNIEAFRAHLEAVGRSPATVARAMSAISGFFGFALDEGVVTRDPSARARRPKVPDVSPRRGTTPEEVRALLAVPDPETAIGLRDMALITVLAIQGWRIAEALGLQVEDLDEEQGHKVAVISGKGGKVARVPLAAETWDVVQQWLDRAEIISGPIFVQVTKGGVVKTGKALSAQAAWKRVRWLAAKAGISREIHPHLFRHGAVTEALAAGVPLHQVQDFARHSDPRTTRRYDGHRNSLANPTPHVLAGLISAPEGEG